MIAMLGLAALAVANLHAFALFAWDKRASRRGAWRVSESRLLGAAAAGAAPGALLACRLLRHKTGARSRAFRRRLHALLALQAAVAAAVLALLLWPGGA